MTISDSLRSLPSVERLLTAARDGSDAELNHATAVALAREVLESARSFIRGGAPAPDIDALVHELRGRTLATARPPVRRVINATGVVIHTNLGRAPLSQRALDAVIEAGRGYSNLEFQLEPGLRGSRHEHCAELLGRLTGAPASVVVNNNAAAVLLVLAELARDREVIVSRGELVEIGGGFRIPEVLEQSGARLVEVGTTNRTYAHDYAAAIHPETAALLRVHSSNFRVIGFTHKPSLEDLVAVARSHDVPLVEDLGSGSFLDSASCGVASEPTVQASLAAGVDLVCFSGDKLLGGPQAGIIVGRADLVARIKRHPLMRALRPDKLTIAALAATLTEYLHGSPWDSVPVWRMLGASLDQLQSRAAHIVSACGAACLRLDIVDGRSAIGGGALPEETLPTRLVRISADGVAASELAGRLRGGEPALVGRVEHDAVILDVRTIDPSEDQEVVCALLRACEPGYAGAEPH
jgi:L-seryl-tRNA(Ser) seleniumtransferase